MLCVIDEHTREVLAIDPQAYIADVITPIVGGHPQRHIDQLMPWPYDLTASLV